MKNTVSIRDRIAAKLNKEGIHLPYSALLVIEEGVSEAYDDGYNDGYDIGGDDEAIKQEGAHK